MVKTIIADKWRTEVWATPTGSVIIAQLVDGEEVTIVIPPAYNFAMCQAIHEAYRDATK